MKNKRVQVIMLPTKNKSNIIKIGNSIKLHYKEEKTLANSTASYTNQYLYFTVDEKPKEGDWCINPKGLPDIFGFDYRAVYTREEILKCRKIIATTDTKLNLTFPKITDKDSWWCGENATNPFISFQDALEYYYKNNLPQPSQAFIEAFCKAGGIWNILVEYEEYGLCIPCNNQGVRHCAHPEECGSSQTLTRLKVNSHNEITIHPIKSSWTREEVTELLGRYGSYVSGEIMASDFSCSESFSMTEEDWIEKNL